MYISPRMQIDFDLTSRRGQLLRSCAVAGYIEPTMPAVVVLCNELTRNRFLYRYDASEHPLQQSYRYILAPRGIDRLLTFRQTQSSKRGLSLANLVACLETYMRMMPSRQPAE